MTRLPITSLALLASLGLAAGCESGPRTVGGHPDVKVAASHKKVLVGETVTLTVASENFVARDADIQWYTTGGRLEEINDGRVAQITFDKPGTYEAGAELLVNGAIQKVATQKITVSPVR